MNSSDPDKSLARVLADWRVAPPRDPGFRPAVWARIIAARPEPTWAGYTRAHAALLAGAFAVALIAGAWAGRAHARQSVAAERTAMAATYVRALDARVMRGP
jgi:hypothetical protein